MDADRSLSDQLRVLAEGAGWLPLAGECLVRVSGAGHREALQRVLTQDILAIPEGQGKLALLLAPKGQFQALMAVFPAQEQTYVLTPPGRATELAKRLSRYLALSRCTAEPLASGGATALLGERATDAAAAVGADSGALSIGGWQQVGPALWFGRTLLGVPGAVVVALEAAALVALDERLSSSGFPRISNEAAELARIRVGFPAWGAELTETVLPPEVGLEKEAISTTKGCYIGQETIARLQTYGHANRSLVGLRQTGGDDEPLTPPLPLSAAGDEKSRGTLTSWRRHPELGGVGLAIVRRELAAPGTALSAAGRAFEVAPFPLW